MCHLPHCHVEVHLRELEKPISRESPVCQSDEEPYLWKKRGMRSSERLRSGAPPYCRAMEMRGLFMGSNDTARVLEQLLAIY